MCLIFLNACVSIPYQLGTGRIEKDSLNSPTLRENQISVGRPNKFLDASDWIWPGSLIGKLLLWDKDVDSHEISEETIEVIRRYIKLNDLRNVKVLINQYSPGIQWRRLFTNRTVGGGWRYTLGLLSVSLYTILPGRFFGGDHYNPYTNTISIYSNDPSIVLHEAGHAKDFGRYEYKGSHAVLYGIPFVSLYYEANATSDTLSYLEEERKLEAQKDAYEILYPAYSTYVPGNYARIDPTSPLLLPFTILGVAVGHIAGQIASSNVDTNSVPKKKNMDE